METLQTSSKELVSYTNKERKSTKHGKHKGNYYTKNKEKYLLAQRRYRLRKKLNQPPKPLSPFQKNKQKQLLKLLVNHRSFVPVPTKLKHPIIKN